MEGSFEIHVGLGLTRRLLGDLDSLEAADRRKALDEMLRVLRPHGVLVLADIANIREYLTYLTSKGVTDMRTVSGGAEAVIMGALSGGSYRPEALLALRP